MTLTQEISNPNQTLPVSSTTTQSTSPPLELSHPSTMSSVVDPESLSKYVENSIRDLVILESSSSDDDDDDGSSYADGAQLATTNAAANLNPIKRLLTGENTDDDNSLVEPEEFAGIEDRVIAKNLRLVVFTIFVTLAIALPIVVYKTMTKNQVESFEGTFRSLSSKVIDGVDVKLARQFTAVDSLRIALTSYASSSPNDAAEETSPSNYMWPNVTLPDWDRRAENARDMGDLLSISLSPVVTEEQRPEWQSYTQENLEWLWEAQQRYANNHKRQRKLFRAGSLDSIDKMVQSTWNNDVNDPENSMWDEHDGQPVSKEIYRPHPSGLGFSAESPENSPFLPVWTQSPPVSTMINLNIMALAAAGNAAAEAIGTREVTLSQVEDLAAVGPSQRALLTDYFTLLMRDHYEDHNARYDGEPVATMSFPVFDTFEVENQGLVAVLTSVIQFQQFFIDVLPGESGTVMAVVSNTCGDVFSYEIDGEVATYLGKGDFHDPLLEYLGENRDFSTFTNSTKYPHGSCKFNEDYCPYSIAVYPTEALHEDHITSDPEVYAISIAVVIIVITLISLAYDLIVQRRMKRIMLAAQNRHDLLTKLYPTNVREILLREEKERKERMVPRRNSNGSFPGSFVPGISSRRSSGDHANHSSQENPVCRTSGDNRLHSNDGPRRNSGDHLISEIFHSSVTGAVTGVNVAVNGVSTVVTGVGAMAGNLLTPLAPSKLRLRFLLKEDQEKGPSGENACAAKPEEKSSAAEKPIADLFPNCTVLFADISGFTAWSSERQPEQVFTLLQEIFQAFDRLAKKRNVFKVETIGDCYVAVTGLPDPQPDHAVRMTKFARVCMRKCNEITTRLEVTLGPGTGGLRMRFGLHSGPVTAGVLRGEKSRFQLFGDTVNTASRIESTGQRDRIQVSQQTADLLIDAGKDNWIVPRKDLVEAKGKGTIQTYWVLTRRRPSTVDDPNLSRPKFVPLAHSIDGDSSDNDSQEGLDWGHDEEEELNESINLCCTPQNEVKAHYERLIDWQVELFSKILVEIIAGRDDTSLETSEALDPLTVVNKDVPVFEEVSECIKLPKFDPKAARARNAREGTIELPKEVTEELRQYIRTIASWYRQNPFHSYAHASHVVQSANKLLGRIVKPEIVNYRRSSLNAIASDLHDYTYGITSDPLTHFAILFATLIHDVDHSGVSNGQRGIEEPHMAEAYQNRSIAEQNSIDLAWCELSREKYQNLTKCICATENELRRFRQLTVNLVMATDIFDKNMKKLQNRRWDKAFHYRSAATSRERPITPLTLEEDRNMRATVVIEHIIQAADVSHCMQHWQVYKRWNERLFQEMFLAYKEGRGGKDPSEGWYDGELWFFDNYIIPLAKKLEECGVFGVSSDECLNYALENRREWAAKGKQVVEEMVQRFRLWSIRGQVLTNPLLEKEPVRTNMAKNNSSDLKRSLIDSSIQFEECVIESEADAGSDDESMVINA